MSGYYFAFHLCGGVLDFLVELVILWGLVYFFFSYSILEKLYALIPLTVFIGLREVIAYRIFFFIFPEMDYFQLRSNTFYFLVFSIIEQMIYFVFISLALSVYKTVNHRIRIRILPFYLFLPLYQLLLLVLYLRTYQEVNRMMVYSGSLILILNILINFVLVFSLDKQIERVETEEKLTALYTQRQIENDYYQLAKKNIADIEETKQYYFSQFQAIRHMLEENPDNPEIAAFIHSSQEEISRNPFPRFCDEEVTNAVLTLKKQMAEREQIHMDISVLIPKTIAVSALDLCSLFCNLLDNAIEACRRNVTIPGYISIKADVSGGYLIVKTENPCEKPPVSDFRFFRTSKENAAEHGYGLKLIEQIAEKYQGHVSVKQENQQFSVSVLLHVAE